MLKKAIKLLSLKGEMKEGIAVVSAEYEMEKVSAKLQLTYFINNKGAVKVVKKMTADKNADVSNLFRFGMQLVKDQFYAYIRPQENGTKSDIRWWKQTNAVGNGLCFVSEAPFSASALHYTIDSLGSGWVKEQKHSNEVEEADWVNLLIDKAQMGLGCVDSWEELPGEEYRLPYGDYEFTFIMTPVTHQIVIK